MNQKQENAYGLVPNSVRAELLELAVSAAKDEGVLLQLGDEKLLEQIDDLLDSLHHGLKKIKDKNQKEEITHGAAMEYAACIIDLIERTQDQKGKWFYHHKVIGTNTLPYVIGDKTVFPYAWALKRIENPESDSVYDKFTQLLPSQPKQS